MDYVAKDSISPMILAGDSSLCKCDRDLSPISGPATETYSAQYHDAWGIHGIMASS